MVFVVVTIVVLRIHAFIALIFAAMLVGILSPVPLDPESTLWQPVLAMRMTAEAFGKTAGSIGIIIVLASIIGKCLLDSGAAEAITRRFLRWMGKDRAPLALLGSGYTLSIPVFFDTVFYLLVPLAKAMRLRTGTHYAFYIMAICAGAGLTHSLVAPTPGPLIMADNLHLDLGTTILAGIGFSILPGVLCGWFLARWISGRLDIPLRESADISMEEMNQLVERKDCELPAFWISILPIALPVLLIAGATVTNTLNESALAAGGQGLNPMLLNAFAFAGDRHVALIVSMLFAAWLLLRHKHLTPRELGHRLEPSITAAGVIILITSAGGAFGAMIRATGIADAIRGQMGEGVSGMALILLAFGVSSVMKIAQGSSTVAMITASAVIYGVIQGVALPYHPVYLFLAIGFGAMVFSWMNDSGFWIISRMAGFTERETLQTWTVIFASLGIAGLVEVLVFSQIMPLNFLP
jgi:GntP family gluconate:H+ symporter